MPTADATAAKPQLPAALNVSCNSGYFPAQHLLDPPTAEQGDSPWAKGLRAVIAHNRSALTGGQFKRDSWVLFSHTATRAVFGQSHRRVGAVPVGFSYLSIERRNGRWAWTGEGDCELERQFPGLARHVRPAHFWAMRPASSATTLAIGVEGGDCGDPDGPGSEHFDHLTVRYTTTRVTITAFTHTTPFPPGDGGACAGVGTIIPATVQLPGPLGSRRIYDGLTFPAAPPRTEHR